MKIRPNHKWIGKKFFTLNNNGESNEIIFEVDKITGNNVNIIWPGYEKYYDMTIKDFESQVNAGNYVFI